MKPYMAQSLAGVAQLVRALVCGTRCRQFESGHPPHKLKYGPNGPYFNLFGVTRFSEMADRQFDYE